MRHLAGQNVKLRMYPVRTRYFDETDWWRVKQGWIEYFDAYLSFLSSFCDTLRYPVYPDKFLDN